MKKIYIKYLHTYSVWNVVNVSSENFYINIHLN